MLQFSRIFSFPFRSLFNGVALVLEHEAGPQGCGRIHRERVQGFSDRSEGAQARCQGGRTGRDGTHQLWDAQLHQGPRRVYFGVAKTHIGLYGYPPVLDRYREEVSPYVGEKGTVRLPLDEALPVGLVRKLVRARMEGDDYLPPREPETLPSANRFGERFSFCINKKESNIFICSQKI